MALCSPRSAPSALGLADLGRCGVPFHFQPGIASSSELASCRLLSVAGAGDVAAVARCLADGARPDHQDPSSGESALHRAAQRCQLPALQALLAAGADPQLRDRGGRTPLFEAANAGHPAAVAALLAGGAQLFPHQGLLLLQQPGRCAGGGAGSPTHAQPQQPQPQSQQQPQQPAEQDDAAFLALRTTCPLAAAAAAGRWPVVAALLRALPPDYRSRPPALRSLRFLIWALASHKAFPRDVIGLLPPRLPQALN
ncbi:Ankyrin repeat-domain domain-containing protein 31 [Tetrabaena socialis]|uniref:Ankyrin repeat-domain domain-containing protein 31 n=1 Tax=Tetrabaena socialis TaxID=47790 RepID=A0A2J8A0W5_9CHLO|nr:Ankyrin repeat-domain domain-containing protein 31 [Tetrabaena socialis]|eukprot:PNH06160.1 Ankyrin repeat-domain domain-containing protein 31 [Tetrabaena socialis]